MSRELKLQEALVNLIATIELHTDCMDGSIERAALDDWIEEAEQVIGQPVVPRANMPQRFYLQWIGVDEALPDDDITVMVSVRGGNEPVWIGFHDGDTWYSVDGMIITVTHWCDLPEPARKPKLTGAVAHA